MQNGHTSAQNGHPSTTCDCAKCHDRMTLVDSIPSLGGLSELLVFHCRACNQVDNKIDVFVAADVPSMWR